MIMLSKAMERKGYALQCSDGEIGKAEEFCFDAWFWTIRYLMDTRNWWPGRHVVVSPRWSESRVFVQLSRDVIRQAPEYSEPVQFTREYEEGLHGRYRRPEYWSEESNS